MDNPSPIFSQNRQNVPDFLETFCPFIIFTANIITRCVYQSIPRIILTLFFNIFDAHMIGIGDVLSHTKNYKSFENGDAQSIPKWGRVVQGTVCPGEISSRGQLVLGTVRPLTLHPGDALLQKSRGRIVTYRRIVR
jgi:hypothetical protein